MKFAIGSCQAGSIQQGCRNLQDKEMMTNASGCDNGRQARLSIGVDDTSD